ncbi:MULTISPECIES: glycosyltransferase [Vibrio]|uniref:glycosyltransferase n=1 Tax=Vibrio TaxID=662 RepID=UPI000B548C1A|nr:MULTISPECIES: glycosyltransferase [Vibrio]ASG04745.1 glycosyltransferase [Vibrio anguillarum]MDQ2192087.1 glycosyltransferase family 2 protein [Vibrio sp. A14(2019)]MDQ2197038.1 glycosyltransferase family 2 protein [Vibrio sp. 2017_1457_11]NNN76257.1 glycosyltransferase family 2 protein [Vibrio sp. B7]NNN92848.1 glycosyltransferase family 2 protein [Vibrio sp. B8-1]
MFNIEVLVSTLNDGLLGITIDSSLRYTIVHQISKPENLNKYDAFVEKLDNVNYVRSFDTGLSKSRNLALENAIGDFLWIMDDDVNIYPDAYEKLNEKIEVYPDVDMFILNHSSSGESEKNDVKERLLHWKDIASISSIDMLVKRSSLGMIRFDEELGLGTPYPSGEEYIFSSDFLKRKLKIMKFKEVYSYHPPITSGMDFFSTPNKLKAKKIMFSRAHGSMFGNFLYIAFLLKKLHIIIKNKAIKNVFLSFN